MLEKRLNDQAKLTRAVNWELGPKIGRAVLLFAAFVPLGATMTACTPKKQPVVEMSEQIKLLVSAPEGAIPPVGLDQIKLDMSQAEVLRILSPLHDVKHWADATPESPDGDYFTYEQDGKMLYAEVMYNGPTVFHIRYGYEDSYVIY